MVLADPLGYYCPKKDCSYQKELFFEFCRQQANKPEPMEYPGVAVGVIVMRLTLEEPNWLSTGVSPIKILLGKRKGPLGTGQYSLPGGKVDFGEPPIETAGREVEEETGLRIRDVAFTGKVSNDYFPEQGKHFINLFYTGVTDNPEDLHVPESEKEKFEAWEWFSPDNLPEGVWMHTAKVIEAVFEGWEKSELKLPGIDLPVIVG